MANMPAENTFSHLAVSQGGQGDVKDYIALLKPRVMSLVVFSAIVGVIVLRVRCILGWP
jgi:heme O synthase-like polyprenyltransferase